MWFRVDDRFWQHPKLMRIPVKQRNDAAGVWVRAGAYCAMNLTDGFIDDTVPSLLNASPNIIRELETADLWLRVDAEGGWRMHDWDAWQPTRAAIEERRQRDRKRKHNDD